MGFLKNHIEKVVFGILVLVLGLSVLFSLSGGGAAGLALTGALPPPGAAEEQDLSRVDRMLARITDAPPKIEVSQNAFTSTLRRECINEDDKSLIPVDAEICPYCGVTQTPPVDLDEHGIPRDLKRIWGLNENDPNEVYRVLDGSGFSALHQWKLGHDPIDPDDTPPLVNYVRILDMEETSVAFELRGIAEITEGVYMLQLRWRYPDETRWEDAYVRVGNRFGRQNEFHAASFTPRTAQDNGRTVDRSFAEIRSGQNVLRLTRAGEGSRGAISERSARLGLYMGPDWTATVRPQETFELPRAFQKENISYMVVDIRADAVVIRAADAEDTITIRKATPEELEAAKPPATQGGATDGMPPGAPGEWVDPGFPFDPSQLPFN